MTNRLWSSGSSVSSGNRSTANGGGVRARRRGPRAWRGKGMRKLLLLQHLLYVVTAGRERELVSVRKRERVRERGVRRHTGQGTQTQR